MKRFSFLVILSFVLFSALYSQDDQEKARLLQEHKDEQAFLGWGFGMGIGAICRFSPKIAKASIVDGYVRVEESESVSPTFLFESHFLVDIRTMGSKNPKRISDQVTVNQNAARFALGPFACVLSTNEKFLDAVGVGIMLGFRNAESPKYFNFGIGVIAERSIQDLRDDFVENDKAPTTATQVEFKKASKVGAVVVLSFSI